MAKYSKIWTIIKHEYFTKVKTKGFIISTLLAPLGILLIIAIPALVMMLSMDSTSKKLAIYDETNNVGIQLVQSDTASYYIATESQSDLDNALMVGDIDGYIKIDKDFLESGNAHVFTKGGGGISFIAKAERKLDYILLEERLERYPEKEKIMHIMNQDVNIAQHKLTEEGKKEDDFTASYAILGYILGFAIYMMMVGYGALVMRGCVEEKANRIIEIIVSSVKPFEIMMGKVLGIGAVGITQVLIWGGARSNTVSFRYSLCNISYTRSSDLRSSSC